MTAMLEAGCSVRRVRSQRAQAVSSLYSCGCGARRGDERLSMTARWGTGWSTILRLGAGGADGFEQGGLRRRFGVEADEEEPAPEGSCEFSGGEGCAQAFGELAWVR